MSITFPEVDLSAYAVGTSTETHGNDRVDALAAQLVESLGTCGMLYLTNHGIPSAQIAAVLSINEIFFNLSTVEKQKYKNQINSFTGWAGTDKESFIEGTPPDLHEHFSFLKHETKQYTDNPIVPNYIETLLQMYDTLQEVTIRLLRLFAVGLKLQDEDFFIKYHAFGQENNSTIFRSNFFPSLQGLNVSPDQVRFGEHTDGTTFTMLFHDKVTGLEVKCPDGEYMAVPPVPGAILMNAGDFMQRWTSDKLISPMHRVVMPTREEDRKSSRQSVVFFVIPDSDKWIKCLDGSDTYPPIHSMEYNYAKFERSLKLDRSLLDTYRY